MNKYTLVVLLTLGLIAPTAFGQTYSATIQTTGTAAPARATTTASTNAMVKTTSTGTSAGTSGSGAGAGKVQMAATGTQKAQFDAFIKIDGVDGESKKGTSSGAKGNVDYSWKVEEGESLKTKGVEPDEIDVASNAQPITPDFSILLGGGDGSASSSEETEKNRSKIAEILLNGAKEEGAPVEQLSINYEKIKTKVRHEVKLFGIIPISTVADIEIDASARAKVSFPWWAFLASGKNEEKLGQQIVETISSVLQKNQALTDGLLLIRTL